MVVDDEPDMLNMLKLVLSKQCACEVILASSGSTALELMAQAVPEVVVTDIKMPDVDGLVLLKKIQELDSTVSVVIMTGYGTIDMAVQSIKDGAYDFLEKPFDKDLIVRVVNNCLERTSLLRANRRLQQQLDTIALPQGFVGQSPALKRVLDLIGRVADTDATVLIRGESGTGKEVAARALHKLSGRRERAMVTVNCPALPEQILESELFGYSRGAFTGAMQEKKGLFLEAHQSTILLDEIADIPVSVQTKLLRVLQEKEIQPLGQNRTIKIDVRVVASTNQDLEAKIRAGEFREDLFYRLNVVTIVMPSLEEMREDVPLLVHYFLSHYKKHYHREELVVSPDVLQYLFQRKWPGNVRELQNTVKRLVLLADSGGGNITDLCAAEPDCVDLAVGDPYVGLYSLHYNEAKNRVVDDFSMEYLNNLLHRHNGNVTNAASDSGMERQALQRLMRRYSILSANFKKPE
jgi:DNA-binding NtrC family response regulator